MNTTTTQMQSPYVEINEVYLYGRDNWKSVELYGTPARLYIWEVRGKYVPVIQYDEKWTGGQHYHVTVNHDEYFGRNVSSRVEQAASVACLLYEEGKSYKHASSARRAAARFIEGAL